MNCGRTDIEYGERRTAVRGTAELATVVPHNLCYDCAQVAFYFVDKGLFTFRDHLSLMKSHGPALTLDLDPLLPAPGPLNFFLKRIKQWRL